MSNELESLVKEELSEVIKVAETLNYNLSRSYELLRVSWKWDHDLRYAMDYTGYIADIMRSSVVFLHASLETFLRDVLRIKLKHDGKLSKIPLYSLDTRDKKFSLADLVAHRGESVDDVINKSIDDHLSYISFSSWENINFIFSNAGMTLKPLAAKYSFLEDMIQKRHQIVHESDLSSRTDKLNKIEKQKIAKWYDAMPDFASEVLDILKSDVYDNEISTRWEREGIIENKQDYYSKINVRIVVNKLIE